MTKRLDKLIINLMKMRNTHEDDGIFEVDFTNFNLVFVYVFTLILTSFVFHFVSTSVY